MVKTAYIMQKFLKSLSNANSSTQFMYLHPKNFYNEAAEKAKFEISFELEIKFSGFELFLPFNNFP